MEKWQISYRSEDVEPLLTEYKALREEQRTRMTMNSSMVNFILLVVGAEIAAYVQMAINLKQHLFLPILLGSPLITTPITIFYYDNTLMIYRIGRYFGSVLYPNITKHIGHNPFQWESFHKDTSGQLAFFAFGRNLFFVLITFGPVLLYCILKFNSPVTSWLLLIDSITVMEKYFLVADILLLLFVLIAWAHSGLYFLSLMHKYPLPNKKTDSHNLVTHNYDI